MCASTVTGGPREDNMKRLFLGVALIGAGFSLSAPSLWAHGGQFRGPGGSVPPSLREPTDPTPPPPPPPSGPPTTPPPTTPPSTTPPPTTPPPVTPPPTTPPPTTDLPSAGPSGKKSALGFENWIFWYENNKEDLENLKRAIYTRITSDNPIGQLGGGRETGGQQGGATQGTASKVESDIIPALKWAMDPDNAGHQDVESASYIALAKVTKFPDDIERIRQGLILDGKKRDPVTIESAALALGLLRRQESAKQFSATELDKVRTVLFGVIEDDKYHTGARAFAAMSLGLLGDQPTGSGEYAGDIEAAQKTTSAHLWDLLQQRYKDDGSVQVSLLIALGLQSKKSITEDMQSELANATLKGRLGKEEISTEVRAYAALALGRIGTPAAIKPLQTALTARTVSSQVQRSVAIALGLLGRLVPVETRLEIAKVLKEGIEKNSDNSIKNFGIISLAYLVNKDIEEGRTDVLDSAKVGDYLLQVTKDGGYIQRPFGALALGLIGRQLSDTGNTIKAYEEFKQKSLESIRDGFQSQKLDKRSRAGFAIALGIIRDTYQRKALTAVVADGKEDRELRGYSAIALGLIKSPNEEIRKTLREALTERSEEMRQQVATALGLLQDSGAVDTLMTALQEAESQNLKGQIVLALAKIGDARAVAPMVKLLKDTKEGDLTRALACAGLGVVGDLEWIPSLSRISKDINYRASVFYVNEVLSIL
jgi:HEAT repeat protein